MATNAVYPSAKVLWLTAGLDMGTGTSGAVLKAYLYRGYTYDATDETLTDVNAAATGGAAVATSAALDGKTISTDAVFDANDVTFSTVASGAACDTIILADSGTGNLVSCYQNATGLPVTPNGTNVPVTWDNGTNKILSLT